MPIPALFACPWRGKIAREEKREDLFYNCNAARALRKFALRGAVRARIYSDGRGGDAFRKGNWGTGGT